MSSEGFCELYATGGDQIATFWAELDIWEKDAEWLGQKFLRLVADMYNIRVLQWGVVTDSTGQRHLQPHTCYVPDVTLRHIRDITSPTKHDDETRFIHLYYNGVDHYDLLVPYEEVA